MMRKMILGLVLVAFIHSVISQDSIDIEEQSSGLFQIEGKVYSPEIENNQNWQDETQLILNSGEAKAFLKNDGTFVFNSIKSGSYVIDIVNPNYVYDPVRVEINNKGKIRARKVNNVQPSQIIQIPYPLKLKAITTFKYYQQREQWKVTDFLFSPMVIMMVLPLILLVLLPKIMSDPETKKEMENMQFPKLGGDMSNMPDVSEMLSKFLGGGTTQPKPSTSGSQTSRPKKRN